MKLRRLITGLTLISATSATADTSFQNGITIEGYLELGQIQIEGNAGDPNTHSVLRGDIDISYKSASDRFGLSLGIDGHAGSLQSDVALYPAFEYTTALGTFSIGAPRSVSDRGYLPEMIIGDAYYGHMSSFEFARSLVAIESFFSSNPLYGLRYDGAIGQTLLGFSAHRLNNNSSPGHSYSLAISRRVETNTALGTLHLSAARERINYDNGLYYTGQSFSIAAENGRRRIGVRYKEQIYSFQAYMTQAYIDYKLSDALTLTASFASVDNPYSDVYYFLPAYNYYGLGIEYHLTPKAYIKASVTDTSLNSDVPSGEIMMGWKF